MEYALQGTSEQDKEHEIWRAYIEFCGCFNHLFNILPEEEQRRTIPSGEFDKELFKQIIASYQEGELRRENSVQKEEIAKLTETVAEWHREAENLREMLDEKQREADMFREQIGKTYASWTYRIGRAATWLPRKLREKKAKLTEKN